MTLLLKKRNPPSCLPHALLPRLSLLFWAHLLGPPCKKKMSSTCASAPGVAAWGALAMGRQEDLVEVLSAAEREF